MVFSAVVEYRWNEIVLHSANRFSPKTRYQLPSQIVDRAEEVGRSMRHAFNRSSRCQEVVLSFFQIVDRSGGVASSFLDRRENRGSREIDESFASTSFSNFEEPGFRRSESNARGFRPTDQKRIHFGFLDGG